MDGIFCFGELLLRMSPVLGDWFGETGMPLYLGGSELNVALALAAWGQPVSYGSALPENYLSRDICRTLESRMVDCSPVQFIGRRIGIYYLPQGQDLRHSAVVYDRDHSAFSELRPGLIDWERHFEKAGWLHISAISPAVSAQTAAVCLEALQAAGSRNMTISMDLNYRSKLWQYGKRPADIMKVLASHCDVMMGNIWSAKELLDIPLDPDLLISGRKADYLEHARRSAQAIQSQFPKCHTVANSFRFELPEGTLLYYGSLVRNGHARQSPEFRGTGIVDRVGTGDCFMAALIYGLRQGLADQQTIDFAAAAAFGKFFEPGDSTRQPVQTIFSSIPSHG